LNPFVEVGGKSVHQGGSIVITSFKRSRSRHSHRRPVHLETLETRRLLAASISVSSDFGGTIADGDTTPSQAEGTDFGIAFVGQSPPLHIYQVTNTSATDDLTLGNLSVPQNYQIEKDLPDVLGPGASAFFAISMTASAQQTNTGTVSFTTNVPGSETFDFVVTGQLQAAAPDADNIFEDVSSFSDADSIKRSEGSDSEGLPVSFVQNSLLRFNVPTGQADVKFTLATTLALDVGATGDGQMLVLRDSDNDNLLDLAELNAPVTTFTPPTGAGASSKTVSLTADTYFVLLRVTNFTTTDPPAEPPMVQIDYSLQTQITAIQPADIAVTFGDAIINDNATTTSAGDGTDFGSAQVGQAAVERTFSVTNTGDDDLVLGGANTTGDFQVVSGLPATLAGGASASVVVRMLTTSAGAKTGTVSFSTNVTNKDPFNFAVSGNVTPAPVPVGDIAVSLQGGAALVSGQGTAIDFGSVNLGQSGPSRVFVVTNAGTGTLTLGSVTLPSGFTLTDPLATTLAPGASDSFTVKLDTSGSAASHSGNVSIASNDPDENPFTFPITGVVSGTGPEIGVSLQGGGALTDDQLAVVEFGNSPLGQAPGQAHTFVVTNSGSTTLNVGTVSVPSGFIIGDPLNTTIAPGQQDTFTLLVSTTTPGDRSGTVSIASNDGDENPFTFPVHASVGVSAVSNAEINVLLNGDSVASGGTIDFGTAPIGGTSPQRTITVQNLGSEALSLGQVALPAGYTLIDGLNSNSLDPGASDTFTVKLETSLAGTRNGQATISNSDSDENPYVLNFTGKVGVAAGAAPFTIGPVSAKVPPVVIAGTKKAKAVASFKIINVSSTVPFSGPVTFILLASDDTTPDPGDSTLGAATRTVKLKGGKSKTIKVKGVFDATGPAGTKTLLVTATTTGSQADGVGPQVIVQAPFVHLTGSLAPQPPLARPLTFGRPAKLSIPLTNGGNVPTSKTPATYTLLVTTAGTPETSVFSTAALGKISLKPGQTKAQKLSVTFPAGSFAPGSYTLLVRITAADLNDTNGQTVALIPFSIS
jgi:hypothetical protein